MTEDVYLPATARLARFRSSSWENKTSIAASTPFAPAAARQVKILSRHENPRAVGAQLARNRS